MQTSFRNLTRKLSLPIVALPAMFVTLASLGGLVSAVVGSAAASQPGSLLFPLRQPALGLQLALTRDPEQRSAIGLRMQAAPVREFEISGEISSIAASEWTVGGQRLRVDALTELDSGLRVGVQARAEGQVMADETWLAREIETVESGEGSEAGDDSHDSSGPGNGSGDSDDDLPGASGSEESEPGDDNDGDDSNSGPGGGDDDGTEEADDSGGEGDGSGDSGSDDSNSGPGRGNDEDDEDDEDDSGSNSGEGEGGEGENDG